MYHKATARLAAAAGRGGKRLEVVKRSDAHGPVSLSGFVSLVEQTATALLKLLALLVVIGLSYVFIQEVTARVTTIEPITVPGALAERGYTSDIAARSLHDGISRVIGQASAPGLPLAIKRDLPDFAVPTVGLSFQTLTAYFRTIIHSRRHRVVSGGIETIGKTMSLIIRIDGQPVFFQEPFDPNLPDAWDRPAAAVLRQTAPYLYLWALDDTDPADALELANHIIMTFPEKDENVAWAYMLRGSHLLNDHKPDEAKEAFMHALNGSAKIAMAHAYLGNALIDLQDFDEAIHQYRLAIELDQHDPAFYYYLGLALRKRALIAGGASDPVTVENEFRIAKEEYFRAITLQPGDATAHINFADVLYGMGAPPVDAMAEWRRAIELDPRSARAHRELCSALLDQHRNDEGAIECETAVKLAPLHAQGLILLATALLNQERVKEALTHYDKAITLEPDNSDFYISLGYLYSALGDNERALSRIETAIRLAPRNAAAHIARAVVLWRRSNSELLGRRSLSDTDWNEIRRELDRAVQIEPTSAEPHARLAEILMSLDKEDDAESEHRLAIALDPSDFDAHMSWGNALKSKRSEEARSEFSAAIELKPYSVTAHDSLVSLLQLRISDPRTYS